MFQMLNHQGANESKKKAATEEIQKLHAKVQVDLHGLTQTATESNALASNNPT